MKGPRAYENTGIPLHEDNQTIIRERTCASMVATRCGDVLAGPAWSEPAQVALRALVTLLPAPEPAPAGVANRKDGTSSSASADPRSQPAGFARMIERAAAGAGLGLKARPHMLRHACGYALANKGHDTRAIQGWLGHRSITSTAVYTALAPNRFKDFWRD
jgi:integrase